MRCSVHTFKTNDNEKSAVWSGTEWGGQHKHHARYCSCCLPSCSRCYTNTRHTATTMAMVTATSSASISAMPSNDIARHCTTTTHSVRSICSAFSCAVSTCKTNIEKICAAKLCVSVRSRSRASDSFGEVVGLLPLCRLIKFIFTLNIIYSSSVMRMQRTTAEANNATNVELLHQYSNLLTSN